MSNQITIDTIDISPLFGDSISNKMQVADQISKACRNSGFFYVSNHGIDVAKFQNVINNFHRTMSETEKLDLAINAYNKNNSNNRSGYYMAKSGEKTVESYCYLNPSFSDSHPLIMSETPLHEINIWPDTVKHLGFKSFCEDHYWKMFDLTSHLLRGFALALGKPEKFFGDYFHKSDTLSSASLIRYPYLENYPPVITSEDGTKLGFDDHLDVSLITILYQTPIQNLQVELADGFKDIPVSANNLLINCGTYMNYITQGYFHAPNHRVKYVNAERLSLPFFVNLGHSSKIMPFSPKGNDCDTLNPSLSYGEYLQDGLTALILKNGQT